MTTYTVCGIAVLASVLCITLQQFAPRWGKLVALGASLLIFVGALTHLQAQWKTLTSLFSLGSYGNVFAALGKAMGIALMVEVTADVCRDVGEENLANRLLFFGKTEILLLSLPLMQSLLELMQEVMS